MAVTYSFLVWLAKWEAILIVGGLAVTIAVQLLTGRVNMQYVLYGRRRDGSRYFSPERVQLLVATIGVAFQYLLTAAQTQSGAMPRLPDGTLELLGLSNAIYLGGKGWTTFRKVTGQ